MIEREGTREEGEKQRRKRRVKDWREQIGRTKGETDRDERENEGRGGRHQSEREDIKTEFAAFLHNLSF